MTSAMRSLPSYELLDLLLGGLLQLHKALLLQACLRFGPAKAAFAPRLRPRQNLGTNMGELLIARAPREEEPTQRFLSGFLDTL